MVHFDVGWGIEKEPLGDVVVRSYKGITGTFFVGGERRGGGIRGSVLEASDLLRRLLCVAGRTEGPRRLEIVELCSVIVGEFAERDIHRTSVSFTVL